MNFATITYILGWILKVEGGLLLLPALVGLIYRESAFLSYLAVAALTFAVGALMTRKKPRLMQVYGRDGFAAVGLGWIAISVFGALPFSLCGDIPFYVDALFETISGFTTTGSSILSSVEELNHCTLFWRSLTHWVGGMGIIVFMLAIVPILGGSTLNLMKAESPGPVVDKLVPRIKQSATILYGIYGLLSAAELILLMLFGMPLFEAICHTFGTVGTGGFSVLNQGYMAYPASLQIITTVFMLLCGTNFTFFYLIGCRRFRSAFKMEEVRVYLVIVVLSILLIGWNIRGLYGSAGDTVRAAAFQVASVITTTGYASADFNAWPELSKMILVVLMFVGACAGSTGGGMKVSRLIIAVKSVKREISTINHQRLVKKIRMDGSTIADSTIHSTHVFIAAYFLIFFISALLVSLDGFDFAASFTAVAATLNNIGPGLSVIGPTGNFGDFSVLSKLVLMFDMLAGRLELFPMLILLAPGSWRRHS
ncbi:MAG: TrkH family potassium uptake protein [Lachnospiraceae bacterium]|nr:TrkH family potassium uptake protein [Lachnospiraceae bacterium]